MKVERGAVFSWNFACSAFIWPTRSGGWPAAQYSLIGKGRFSQQLVQSSYIFLNMANCICSAFIWPTRSGGWAAQYSLIGIGRFSHNNWNMHKAIFLGYDKLNFLCAYFTNALWWSCWAHLLIRKGRFSSQATQLYHDLMHHHHHHHCSHHCNHSHIIKDNLSSSCIDCSSIGSYFDKLNEDGLCIATHCNTLQLRTFSQYFHAAASS